MRVGYERLPGLSGAVVMVDGCFDPLHAGHLAYFERAAELGLPLLVNVQDDSYIRRVKHRPNLLPETDRVALLDALKQVSYVHLCTTSTEDVLGRLRPAVYAKGADWELTLPEAQRALCEEAGIRIAFLDSMKGSSTRLLDGFLGRGRLARDDERSAAAGSRSSCAYSALVTSHTDAYLSGVAKFNLLLAGRLGIPRIAMREVFAVGSGPLLLSIKLSDNGAEEMGVAERAAEHLSAGVVEYDLFLHAYGGLRQERALAERARRVWGGNVEIAERVRADGVDAEALWCPALLDRVRLDAGGLKLLSFGMAHKVQSGRFEELRGRLEDAAVDYTLMVSTAFHEKAGFGEIDEVSAGFLDLFGDRVRLLGFLADPAIGHFLAIADAFVAFFPQGVRANNTSVNAAMVSGTPVITNLDERSPAWMRHGTNMLDLPRLSARDLTAEKLAAVGARGRGDAEANAGWPELASRLAAASFSGVPAAR